MVTTQNSTTISIPATRYEDQDDCLEAAAGEVQVAGACEGWTLGARWADDERDEILLDVPAWAAAGVVAGITGAQRA